MGLWVQHDLNDGPRIVGQQRLESAIVHIFDDFINVTHAEHAQRNGKAGSRALHRYADESETKTVGKTNGIVIVSLKAELRLPKCIETRRHVRNRYDEKQQCGDCYGQRSE